MARDEKDIERDLRTFFSERQIINVPQEIGALAAIVAIAANKPEGQEFTVGEGGEKGQFDRAVEAVLKEMPAEHRDAFGAQIIKMVGDGGASVQVRGAIDQAFNDPHMAPAAAVAPPPPPPPGQWQQQQQPPQPQPQPGGPAVPPQPAAEVKPGVILGRRSADGRYPRLVLDDINKAAARQEGDVQRPRIVYAQPFAGRGTVDELATYNANPPDGQGRVYFVFGDNDKDHTTAKTTPGGERAGTEQQASPFKEMTHQQVGAVAVGVVTTQFDSGTDLSKAFTDSLKELQVKARETPPPTFVVPARFSPSGQLQGTSIGTGIAGLTNKSQQAMQKAMQAVFDGIEQGQEVPIPDVKLETRDQALDRITKEVEAAQAALGAAAPEGKEAPQKALDAAKLELEGIQKEIAVAKETADKAVRAAEAKAREAAAQGRQARPRAEEDPAVTAARNAASATDAAREALAAEVNPEQKPQLEAKLTLALEEEVAARQALAAKQPTPAAGQELTDVQKSERDLTAKLEAEVAARKKLEEAEKKLAAEQEKPYSEGKAAEVQKAQEAAAAARTEVEKAGQEAIEARAARLDAVQKLAARRQQQRPQQRQPAPQPQGQEAPAQEARDGIFVGGGRQGPEKPTRDISEAIREEVIKPQTGVFFGALKALAERDPNSELAKQEFDVGAADGKKKTIGGMTFDEFQTALDRMEHGAKDDLLNKAVKETPGLEQALRQVEVRGYRNVQEEFGGQLKDVPWNGPPQGDKTRTQEVIGPDGTLIATLTEKSGTTRDGKPCRTINFPEKLDGNGPMNAQMALKDENGKNVPLYFTADYDKDGKLTQVSCPQPVHFDGEGPDAVGYVLDQNGKKLTLPVDKQTYEMMQREVDKNKGIERRAEIVQDVIRVGGPEAKELEKPTPAPEPPAADRAGGAAVGDGGGLVGVDQAARNAAAAVIGAAAGEAVAQAGDPAAAAAAAADAAKAAGAAAGAEVVADAAAAKAAAAAAQPPAQDGPAPAVAAKEPPAGPVQQPAAAVPAAGRLHAPQVGELGAAANQPAAPGVPVGGPAQQAVAPGAAANEPPGPGAPAVRAGVPPGAHGVSLKAARLAGGIQEVLEDRQGGGPGVRGVDGGRVVNGPPVTPLVNKGQQQVDRLER